MPSEWRRSTTILIYKNMEEIKRYTNFQEIKLTSHIMKSWKRVIEHKIKHKSTISNDQFGFMPKQSTMKVFLRTSGTCLMKKYKEVCKYLHMVIIVLEKAYDRVPKEVIRWILQKKIFPIKYIKFIKDM